jgi:hypothetical protein
MRFWFLLCLLLVTPRAWAAQIQVDTSALTPQRFRILPSVDWHDARATPYPFDLTPGIYTFQTNSDTAGYPSLRFVVTPNGTVEYGDELTGVLAGHGSSTLKVKGATVTLNTRALSDVVVQLNSFDWEATGVRKLALIPGKHVLKFNGDTVYSRIYFYVLPNGTVTDDDAYGAAVAGQGTATLLVRGHVIYVDARAFVNGIISVDTLERQATDFKLPFVLVPGTHQLRKHHGNGYSTNLYFTVTVNGQVQYDTTAGVFSGYDTNTLMLNP